MELREQAKKDGCQAGLRKRRREEERNKWSTSYYTFEHREAQQWCGVTGCFCLDNVVPFAKHFFVMLKSLLVLKDQT